MRFLACCIHQIVQEVAWFYKTFYRVFCVLTLRKYSPEPEPLYFILESHIFFTMVKDFMLKYWYCHENTYSKKSLNLGDENLLALNTYKYWCGVETVERMLPSWIFQILILRTSEYSKYWDDRETYDTCCRLLPGSYTQIWIFHISIVTRVPHLWVWYCDEYTVFGYYL